MVNLAYALLAVGSIVGKDLISEKQWKLGTNILLKIVKRKRQVASCIMSSLRDRIATGDNTTQYIGRFSVINLCFLYLFLFFVLLLLNV